MRKFTHITAFLGNSLVVTTCLAGYLDAVGPSPVRLQAPPGPVTQPSAQTALPAPVPAPAVTGFEAPALVLRDPPAPVMVSVGRDHAEARATEAVVEAPSETRESQAIPAQAFVEFFRNRPGPNAREESVVVPVSIHPPSSEPRGSSSATYISQ